MKNDFSFEKPHIEQAPYISRKRRIKDKPVASAIILAVIFLGCIFAELIMTKDPAYLDLMNCSKSPNSEFLFGTDTLGRDIFSMIWYGGRISLIIGLVSTLISTLTALIYGTLSALAPKWLDTILMNFADIFLSIPSILLVLFFQAVLGKANVISIAIVVGLTSWPSMSKIVRIEARQLRASEYIQASKTLGGSFWHILKNHFIPNFISSTMFIVVMNVRNAIIAESTLSFIGMGLPIEIISWGSMLSLAEKAILTKSWWILVIPGIFLILTIFCMTEIGNFIRKNSNREYSKF